MICKDISIEYWSKRKKRHCFTILIPKQNKFIYIKKIYISSAMENGKYKSYQYNSEQVFINM